ncbi:GNAT family N-acetyltransferase [Mycobacterium sp. AZCC_0083]|uniref:GNAT family N-acetyltransferase n=1 Tax=Mycobacterium sp. AZCC_0083 TaxID=2735882 RepID=UPI0016205368|nr:GNAT family N-acetyltransferase [Mycobacterium sp. AZCC_0083]MBB5161842.1 ribosomal protein S18 acetylase RimI-like enzyme [Mycobacterium sp. AZCC_0083]
MADIALRPATTDDAEFFFALHKRSLGPYVDQIWGWDDDEQRAYMTGVFDLGRVRVIVVDGVDVGRLDVEERDDEVFLGLIELAPEYQGRGIGSRVISELIDGADGKRVTLSVLGVNERAYQLYRRLGFAEVSRDGVAPEVRIRMVAVIASR